MKFFIRGRRAGKTTKALEAHRSAIRAGKSAVLIVHSEQEVVRLLGLYEDEDVPADSIISVSRLSSLRGRSLEWVGIDNIDIVLFALIHQEVDFVTGTGELVE